MITMNCVVAAVQGEDQLITIRCKDFNQNDIPFITGDRLYFAVKSTVLSPLPLFETVVDTFDGGKALVKIQAAQTAGLGLGTYKYSVKLKTSTGDEHTLVRAGDFIVKGAE